MKSGPAKARPAGPIVPLMEHITISTQIDLVYSGILYIE